jgi:hypothetical protein
MTPKELRDKWNLKNSQLACVIGKTEETVKKYMNRPGSNGYRNAPTTVQILCKQLDIIWTQAGQPQIFF